MALTPSQLQELNARIGWLLDKHLAPIFKPGVHLTFIARTPGNDEADVLVTTERDLNDVIALALRSLGRAAVGKGVALVPRSDGTEAAQPCRIDGRCQQAIDYGTEGMSNGHCPKGQCAHRAHTSGVGASGKEPFSRETPLPGASSRNGGGDGR